MIHVTHNSVMSRINQAWHVRRSHVPHAWATSHMHESCHVWIIYITNRCAITTNWVKSRDVKDKLKCMPLHVSPSSFTWDMNHSYVAWLIHIWRSNWPIHMWHASSHFLSSFICGMPHSYLTWPIHMWYDSSICNMTHVYVTWLMYTWHDSCIFGVTYSHVACLFTSVCVHLCVTWLMMTHVYMIWLIQIWR